MLAFKRYQHPALNLACSFSNESVVVQDRSRANGTLSVGFAYSTGKQVSRLKSGVANRAEANR